MYWQRIVIFLLLLVICASDNGQNARPVPLKRCPVKTINFEQGLMNIAITSAITDGLGFTWFSTKTGLQRYNGYVLETITPVADGDTIAIHYPVFFFAKDDHSFLIGYKNGILEFNAENNAFKKIVTLAPRENLHYSLIPFKASREGVWCLEENKGIILYNAKSNATYPVPSFHPESADTILHSDDLFQNNKIIAVNDDFIFMRLSPQTIVQIDVKTRQLHTLDFPNEVICGLGCTKDKLFIVSKDDLSCVRIRDGITLHKFLFKQLTGDAVNFSTLDLIANHHLLVAVEKHLYEFDTSCICLKEITDLNSELFVKTGTAPFIYQDQFRRIWLLTLNEIKRIQNVEIPFEHLLYPKEKNNFVRSLYLDEKKRLLISGCYNGGIQLYDSSGRPLWDRSLITKAVKDVIGIEKLSTGNYLVITLHRGLFLLNIETKQLQEMDLNKPSCSSLQIRENAYSNSLQRIDDSTVLISTRSNVYRCIFRGNQIKAAQALFNTPQLYSNPVTTFIHTSDRTIWTGTESGVILKLDPGGALKTITIPDNYFVRCMAEDSLHRVWVGTEKGLFIYSASGELLKKFTRETGLLNDFVYALLPDDNRNSFFSSTNLGISYISRDGNIKNFTKELGLQENEFNTQSSVRESTGKLFFGGTNGITAFYPAALTSGKDTPFIHITRLVVNDSIYNSFAGAWNGSTLHLAYDQNHLQFDMAATGLLNPNEYVYRYRLHGFEKTWQITHQPSGIRYTLAPGNYLLEIRCSPILSSNSVFYKQIVVIIEPPWWQTWWFIGFSLILLITAVTYIVLKYNKRKYEEQIRTLQLQSEIQNERERISKELHDNIGTQLSYISSNMDWMIDAPVSFTREEEKSRLSAVNKTAKEMISDLRQTIWAIKKESVPLDELSDKLKSFIQSQLLLRPDMDIRIEEDIRNNIRFCPTDALNIYRISQEAIVNCIKHSDALQLSFFIQSGTNESFAVVIEDNGKGFEPNRENTGHYGLENMRHRAIDLGASFSIVSAKGKGTRIAIERYMATT
jgi:signal transduction histidine kinase/ligand-binding sensor domain-containing protein